MEQELKNYGNRILAIMQTKGMTKVELAEKMGIERQNVNALLQTPNIDKLMKITSVLGITLSDLVDEKPLPTKELKGFVEYRNKVYVLNTIEDMERCIEIIRNN